MHLIKACLTTLGHLTPEELTLTIAPEALGFGPTHDKGVLVLHSYQMEGFSRVCAQAGLTGEQGVLIPARNRPGRRRGR